MANDLWETFDNSFLFTIGVLIVVFIVYRIFFAEALSLYNYLSTSAIILLAYFIIGKDEYKQKYYSPKVIGGSVINHSYLPNHIYDISHIMKDHFLIFLGGFVEELRGEVLGHEGVLVIHKRYLIHAPNRSCMISPQCDVTRLRLSPSKFNEILALVEYKGGNSSKMYLAIQKDLEIKPSELAKKDKINTDITSKSFAAILEDLWGKIYFLKASIESKGRTLEEGVQNAENLLTPRKKLFGLGNNRRPIKDEE